MPNQPDPTPSREQDTDGVDSTAGPPDEDSPVDGTQADPGRDGRNGLPVGPVGLLVITAMALVVAFTAAIWLVGLFADDGAPEGTDVRTVLGIEDEASGGDPPAPAGVGDPAPDVALEWLDGSGTGRLSEFLGVPVVLNFWSSTCAPCLAEMPDFERVHRDLGDEVAVLGVDVTDTVEAGREMVERTGVTYPSARDPRAELMALFGGTGLPRTVLLDAAGTVVDAHTGALTESQLRDLLDRNGLVAR